MSGRDRSRQNDVRDLEAGGICKVRTTDKRRPLWIRVRALVCVLRQTMPANALPPLGERRAGRTEAREMHAETRGVNVVSRESCEETIAALAIRKTKQAG